MQNNTNSFKDILNKARKRQFDSRWRANIAGCFETLLQIIPINKRAIKKQSKARILESTINHLDFLESTYVDLLHEKARRLEVSSEASWCSERLRELEEQFIKKELSKPRKSSKLGKRINKKTTLLPTFNRENEAYKEVDIDIVLSKSSDNLHCNESDEEDSFFTVSLENTPKNYEKAERLANTEPKKRRVKTIPSWPLKCQSVLMKQKEFLKNAPSFDMTSGFRRFSNEYDEKEDGEKIGESDPWLANNLPQRCLFNKHFTNGPAVISPTTCLPLAPNDSLMLMDGGGEYAGRHSPLFPQELEESVLSVPQGTFFDDSAWSSLMQ